MAKHSRLLGLGVRGRLGAHRPAQEAQDLASGAASEPWFRSRLWCPPPRPVLVTAG